MAFEENRISLSGVKQDEKYLTDLAVHKDGTIRKAEGLGVKRTSDLISPIMLLVGHSSQILSCRFHPDGTTLVSAGSERVIFVWDVFSCKNTIIFQGHKAPITELCFTKTGDYLISSSIDKTVAFWDYETGAKFRSFKGHDSYVNCCSSFSRGSNLVLSGSDDNFLNIWDERCKKQVFTFDHEYPVLCCSFDSFGHQVISGGIDHEIKIWDLRKNEKVLSLIGHNDSITGMQLSPDGAYLLTNSMDNTLRLWDIYPYTDNSDRCLKNFSGHYHNFEKNLLRCAFSNDSKYVACGSSDALVNIWDSVTSRVTYRLPGHNGSVNDVQFHPNQPIVLSCGNDSKLYLGELDL